MNIFGRGRGCVLSTTLSHKQIKITWQSSKRKIFKPPLASHFDNNKETEGQKKLKPKKLSFTWANMSQSVLTFHLWSKDYNIIKHTDLFKWGNIYKVFGNIYSVQHIVEILRVLTLMSYLLWNYYTFPARRKELVGECLRISGTVTLWHSDISD